MIGKLFRKEQAPQKEAVRSIARLLNLDATEVAKKVDQETAALIMEVLDLDVDQEAKLAENVNEQMRNLFQETAGDGKITATVVKEKFARFLNPAGNKE